MLARLPAVLLELDRLQVQVLLQHSVLPVLPIPLELQHPFGTQLLQQLINVGCGLLAGLSSRRYCFQQ